MSSQAIDYGALAQQAGAVDSQPPQAPDHAALAKQAGAVSSQPAGGAPDYAALAKQAGAVDSQPPPQTFGHAASNWWDQVNPVANYKGLSDTLYKLVTHPVQTLTQVGEANDMPRVAAAEAFKRGDYTEGVRHGLNWLLNAIPGVGSTEEKASDAAQHGDLAGGIGITAGVLTNLLLAKGLPKSVPVAPRVAADLTPEEASAVAFADKNEIPISQATRTGSKPLANLQASVANAPGGAKIAKTAAANTRAALGSTGERLAGEAPQPPFEVAPNGHAVFHATGPDGSNLAITASKDSTQGYQAFNPQNPATADLHNLQPDKLDSMLGSNAWRKQLADVGYTPENVTGFTSFYPSRDGKTMLPGMTYVAPQFRRQGLATAMYDATQRNMPDGMTLGSGAQRPMGEAFRAEYDQRPPVEDLPQVPSATPESAGAGVTSALGDLSRQQGAGATKAYTALEQIEANPKNLQTIQTGSKTTQSAVLGPEGQPITSTAPVTKQIALPVDMRSAKTALQPVLDRLEQEMPLAQQQSSRGLQAIRNVIGQDDYVPASVADQNLSALKQLQREAVHPKTLWLANKAVNAVAPLVDAAVAQAGPDATAALNEGRALTKAKYATDATADQLQTEPVRLFNQLTAQKDTAINLLRDVRAKAPGSMPAVGRAYLEGLMDSATSEGGKPGAGTAYSQWQKLGPQTKQILFPSAEARSELDNFFALAKKTGENPNPSGTAYVNGSRFVVEHPITGVPYVLYNNALARLLFNPSKAKLLQTGMRLPLRSPARAIVGSSILRAAGDGAVPIGAPATGTPGGAAMPLAAGGNRQQQ